MEGRFARAMGRMHRVGSARLADSIGRYLGPDQLPVENLPLQVERNMVRNGPNGLFVSNQVGVSWSVCDLPRAAIRTGIFEIGCERLLVEEIEADDGHRITAACQVLK